MVRPFTRVSASLAVAAALVVAAGCSSTSPPQHDGSRMPAVVPSSLAVRIDGSRFVGVPARVRPGAVSLHFYNGTAATHMAGIAHLIGGHTAAEVRAYLSTPAAERGLPSWLRLVGGVDDLGPGHSGSWVGRLARGSYLLVSLSPDATGKPDALDGLMTAFDVPPGRDSAAPSGQPVDATVTLGVGGTLRMSRLAAGATTVRLVNDDTAARAVDVTSIRPGKTFEDVMREARRGGGVPKDLVPLGGSVVPAHGSVVIGIEATRPGIGYVVFDIDHVAQDAMVHQRIA